MQDVPITIQALTAETLTQLNVQTFDQFVKYLPNVTTAGAGPGQSNVYMRGLSIGAQRSMNPASWDRFQTSPCIWMTNRPRYRVATWTFMPPTSSASRCLRTTRHPFRSGAEAGVLRYITNKPKLDVTEGIVNAGYSYTAHGDPNSNVDATLNLPLIPDTLALRTVIYDDSRVLHQQSPGTFTRSSTDLA